jgi:hypothetical protein
VILALSTVFYSLYFGRDNYISTIPRNFSFFTNIILTIFECTKQEIGAKVCGNEILGKDKVLSLFLTNSSLRMKKYGGVDI